MVIYFAEESYEWKSKDETPFPGTLMSLKTALLASRAKYRNSRDGRGMAGQSRRGTGKTCMMCAYVSYTPKRRKTSPENQNLGEITMTCGVCIVCQSKMQSRKSFHIVSDTFHEQALKIKCSPLKGVRPGQNCPQLKVSICRILEHSHAFTKIALCRYSTPAKKGSMAPNLLCCREKAVGLGVEILAC